MKIPHWIVSATALAAVVGASASAVAASEPEVVAFASSQSFRLDTREGDRGSTGTEELAYSSLWSGDTNSVVEISQDGVAIASGLFGEGVERWSAPSNGTYTLTHTTFSGSKAVKVETATFVVTGFPRRVLWPVDDPFEIDRITTFNGFLVDPDANYAVVGTIGVKAGTPRAKTGDSRLTATIKLVGQKQVTVKGYTRDGSFVGAARNGMVLDIQLGKHSISGRFGRYLIDGSRDMFAAKDADSKAVAAAALERCKGSYVVAWRESGEAVWSALSITFRNKGDVKVKGTLADGATVSTTAPFLIGAFHIFGNTPRLLVGEKDCAVPICWSKRKSFLNLVLWISEDGTVACEGLPEDAESFAAPVVPGPVPAMELDVDVDALAAALPALRADLTFSGTSPLKQKVKCKSDGTFTGKFTAYVDGANRAKAVSVRVNGVYGDGAGVGSASVKGKTGIPVELR